MPLDDYLNKSYENVTIEINGKSDLDDLQNFLNEEGQTKVQIQMKKENKTYLFSLKKPENSILLHLAILKIENTLKK